MPASAAAWRAMRVLEQVLSKEPLRHGVHKTAIRCLPRLDPLPAPETGFWLRASVLAGPAVIKAPDLKSPAAVTAAQI